MKMFKHAILSLIRKPAKASMIFAILFVVFGLVFTGIIIQNSISESKKFVRRELGAIVSLQQNYVQAMNDKLAEEDYKQLALSEALARTLADDPAVNTLYLDAMVSVFNPDLKQADFQSDGAVTVAVSSTDGPTSFFMSGSNQLVPIEFAYGSLRLTQGHHRTAEDAGRNTVLMTEEFATKNNLSVGDTVEFSGKSGGEKIGFEIIGLFSQGDSFSAGVMYTSYESLALLSGDSNTEPSGASFILNDPLDVDAFIARSNVKLPSKYLYLDANNSEYNSLTRPLDLMETITNLLLWVVFIAGAVIMIAIITIFVRDRKFEIGLLLAGGEAKLKITAQFILEIMLVAILAFGGAAGISSVSSGYVADWIAETQLVEETEPESAFTSISFGSVDLSADVNIDDVAESFDIAVDLQTIGNLILISFGLLLFSTLAPLMIILGYKPREALQD